MKVGGRALDIITLPMPKKIIREGLRLPATYANFYIANTCVLVPTFADPADEVALSVLRECFPNRNVIGIDCRELIWGLGAFHCLTNNNQRCESRSGTTLVARLLQSSGLKVSVGCRPRFVSAF